MARINAPARLPAPARASALLLAAAVALGMPAGARAQEPVALEEAPAPKPTRPKPAKPAPKPAPEPTPRPAPGAAAKPEAKPEAKPVGPSSRAEPAPEAPRPPAAERAPAIDRAPPDATFSAPPTLACGPKAARFEGEKGVAVFVTRAGRAQIENPLRPLTPETTEVLQVTIGGKVATAYGPDLSALRRGGTPGAVEAQLGTAIRWQDDLPALPDPLTIVSEDGRVLARLGFRTCEEAPAVKAPPPVARKETRPNRAKPREAGTPDGQAPPARGQAKAAAPRTPPGFSLPQGAIAE